MSMASFTDYYSAHKSEIDGILLDADGTLTAQRKALPGANEFLRLLDQDDFPYLLLTNDSGRSPAEKAAVLRKAGVEIAPDKICSSGMVLKNWARENPVDGLFFQSGYMGNPGYPELAGIEVTTDPARIDECRGILMGEGVYDWKVTTETIFKLLHNHPEYPLIVCNPDCFWSMKGDGSCCVGDGGIARFICLLLYEAGIEKTPLWIGKPCRPVFDAAFAMLQEQYPDRTFARKRIAMIGDSLDSDIAGANNAELRSCLVLTGVSSRSLAESADAAHCPSLIFDRI